MWTIAAVNKKFDGPLGSYNGLTDVHLAHYFARPFRRSHLKSANLITSDGIIVPERRVKFETLQYEKKKKLCDLLATAVVQNAVHEEGSWNKKLCNYLENISKMNIVENVKKTKKKKLRTNMDFKNEFFSEAGYFKPSEENFRKHKNILCYSAPTPFFCPSKQATSHVEQRCLSATEHSPYVTPLLMSKSFKQFSMKSENSYSKQRKKKRHNRSSETIRNPLSKFGNHIKKLPTNEQQLDRNSCKITLFYHGSFPFTSTHKHVMQEVIIKQQHCGGTPVVVYKGKISVNECLTFISLEHKGFSFSITVFLDGIRDLKLSSCCVFRYPKEKRLGGSGGSFSIKCVQGGTPCLQCQYHAIGSKSLNSLRCEKQKQNKDELDFKTKIVTSQQFKNTGKNQPECVNPQPLMLFNDENAMKENKDDGSELSIESINGDEDTEEISDHHDSDVSKSSEEKIIEEMNYPEDIKGNEDASYNSDTSIASMKETIEISAEMEKIKEIDIHSRSSSDDDNGQQHIILASVHGSPS